MPTPAFEWKNYRVTMPARSPVRALAEERFSVGGLPGEEDVVHIPLPVLDEWPAPIDKARILLESAAEIEHALMVQYLYAAYSLKSSSDPVDDIIDPAQILLLDESRAGSWFRTLLGIAHEEMGHLMSVENLLLFLGMPPNFEREDFPPPKDIYPFKLHLEPFTQNSLAKYVVAESALEAPDIEDIKIVAMGAESGATINHVGILYGLLGLIFSTQEQVQKGETSIDPWEQMLNGIWQAAKIQNADPAAWHLPEAAFRPESVSQQGAPEDWQMPGPQSSVRVHRAAKRDDARAAIRDIAEQGEGPTSSGMTSHFTRFSSIYRQVYPLDTPATLPSIELWATRAVPTDPTPSHFTDLRTRRWAELADSRYALLLGFLEHYLLTSSDERQLLTNWSFSEMRSRLGYIARLLTKMPRGNGGVAAAPFTLPTDQHLPAAEGDRWKTHQRRLEFAIAKIQEMQAADSNDAADEFLQKLLASDQARLALASAKATGQAFATSFVRDILPLFRPIDIEHMRDASGLDLALYDDVRELAEGILERVQGIGSIMPPPPDYPWTAIQIALFRRWRDENFPP